MYVYIHYIILLTTPPKWWRKNWCYVHNRCIISSFSPHTPKWWCMRHVYGIHCYIHNRVNIYSLYHLSYHTPKWWCMPHVYIHKRQSNQPNIWQVHNQVICIEFTVHTLANIRHSHWTSPTTQLSWLSLKWTDVYTSSGGRKNWCYVHNRCM